jgi:GNAT superfamily N-acetyltransferase
MLEQGIAIAYVRLTIIARPKFRRSGEVSVQCRRMTKGEVTVRTATPADNDAIIALELRSALVLGEAEEVFDRSPDAFACCRIQDGCRVIVGELEGRVIGILAGVMFRPALSGKQRSLVYIHRARVDPGYQGRGVGMALSTELFRWCAENGGEGPCYAIAPGNTPSLNFVEQGGGRWPRDLSLVEIDVSQAREAMADSLAEEFWPAVVELINATHVDEEFFEPLTVESLRARLTRDPAYAPENLRGVFEGAALVAAGGVIDKGRYTERIRIDRTTGEETRTRSAAVVDWGFASGHEDDFARLLAALATEARALGRKSMTVCEPRPAAITPSMPHQRSAIALFTPSLGAPASVDGLYFDLLNL